MEQLNTSHRHKKKCPICERWFGAHRSDTTFCSIACRMKAHRRRQPKRSRDQISAARLATKRAKTHERICRQCGSSYSIDGTQTASLYCSHACKQRYYRRAKCGHVDTAAWPTLAM